MISAATVDVKWTTAANSDDERMAVTTPRNIGHLSIVKEPF